MRPLGCCFFRSRLQQWYGACLAALLVLMALVSPALAQGSDLLGNGLSAGAIGRGGIAVLSSASPLDAVEGNPAGLSGTSAPTLDAGAVGLFVGGSFSNAANPDAHPHGVAGAIPFGAFALPLGHGHHRTGWTASLAETPEILVRSNWNYVDVPGTAGVSYGLQRQEDEIIAIRSSLSVARPLGPHWSAGVSLGVVYNHNDLHAPYIFQQQPQLQGLKVLLGLVTSGYGWNGSAGAEWHPSSQVRVAAAWKSGTTLRTGGDASGTASALFTALGVAADPVYHYHAQVENHLPQSGSAGVSWKPDSHLIVSFATDVTAWRQAFQNLPILLTGGTNATINSVAGSATVHDDVPLNWSNQVGLHVGAEIPLTETWTVRGGFAHANDPVPNATLSPLTAAIMQNALATGAGWSRGRWHVDAAWQAQLPATQTVAVSGLEAGEYSNSRLRIWTQSLTLTARARF